MLNKKVWGEKRGAYRYHNKKTEGAEEYELYILDRSIGDRADSPCDGIVHKLQP